MNARSVHQCLARVIAVDNQPFATLWNSASDPFGSPLDITFVFRMENDQNGTAEHEWVEEEIGGQETVAPVEPNAFAIAETNKILDMLDEKLARGEFIPSNKMSIKLSYLFNFLIDIHILYEKTSKNYKWWVKYYL